MKPCRLALFLICLSILGPVQPAAATAPEELSPAGAVEAATTVLVRLTCGELQGLNRTRDKRVGPAILWLDAVYTRRHGLPDYTVEWARTVAQGVTGICAIDLNANRPVLDVIEEVHRDYGGKAAKP
jgi:hypothetical protein